MAAERPKAKVLVIGLDGATNDLLVPWMAAGHLPTLARFAAEGTTGDLMSVIHPLTAPAWTSFMTGKNPGKHGVFDFIRRREGSYDVTLVDSRTRDQDTLWKLLGDRGLRVGVMNVPVNYPPPEVNGWLISWMDAPDTRTGLTHPAGLLDEVRAATGGYMLTVDFHAPVDEHLRQIHEMVRSRAGAIRFLMASRPWDFMVALFGATDFVQHAFWKHMDPEHPGHTREGAARYGTAILDVYRRIDGELGSILEAAGEDTLVFIMSDHGAGPLRKVVNLNRWLAEAGYLSPRSGRRGRRRSAWLRGMTRAAFGAMKRWLPAHVKGALRKALPGLRDRVESYLFASGICWQHTRAFALGAYGNIWLNVRGREPRGVVEPGEEYEALREEISRRLLSLRDPDNGECVVEAVHRREDLYEGPFMERAPDLLVQWRDYAYHSRQRFGEDEEGVFAPCQTMPLSELEMNGFHRLNGVLMARGPGVRADATIEGAHITDLAPTILYAFGLPASDDMDGCVLAELFTDEYRSTRTTAREGSRAAPVAAGRAYSRPAEEKVKDRLRSLGYID